MNILDDFLVQNDNNHNRKCPSDLDFQKYFEGNYAMINEELLEEIEICIFYCTCPRRMKKNETLEERFCNYIPPNPLS